MALLAAAAGAATSRFPTVAVEVQWTAGVWTAITAYVSLGPDGSPAGMSRGRPDEFVSTQPGSMDLTLDNHDGRFTSGNAASPYYPNVRLGRPIRLVETWLGVQYVRWTGYVKAWPTTWPGSYAKYSLVKVTCDDRLAPLGRLDAFHTILSEEILADSPSAYYTLTDPEGAQADLAGKRSPLVVRRRGDVGTIEYESATGPPSDDASSVKLTRGMSGDGSVDGYYLTAKSPYAGAAAVTEVFSLEVWFTATPDANSPTMTLAWLGPDQQNFYLLRTYTTGRLRAEARAGGVSVGSITGPASLVNDTLHQAVLTVEASPTANMTLLKLYSDGVLRGSLDLQPRIAKILSRLTLGMDTYVPDSQPPLGAFNGGLSHVAVYPTVLTAARILSHYQAGSDGFTGESTDARFLRWARLAGVTDVSAEAGGSTLGLQQSAGATLVSLLEEVAAAEHAPMFVDGFGQLVMHARSHRYNQASALTLTGEQIGAPEFVADDQYLVNDVTYTRPGGAPQRYVDEISADPDTGYGRYPDSKSLPYASDDQAYAAAAWRVRTYSGIPDVASRLSQFTVDLLALSSSALVTSLLGLDVGSRVTLTSLPTQVPGASVDVTVEGISEQVGTDVWQLSFNTSPAVFGQAWVLGDPVLSVLGLTTILAF